MMELKCPAARRAGSCCCGWLWCAVHCIAATDALPPQVAVEIAHLRSYRGMGKASVSCTAGCTCKDSIIDGSHGAKWVWRGVVGWEEQGCANSFLAAAPWA